MLIISRLYMYSDQILLDSSQKDFSSTDIIDILLSGSVMTLYQSSQSSLTQPDDPYRFTFNVTQIRGDTRNSHY